MQPLDKPLTDAELDRLGKFLQACKGNAAMNPEELDGFFCALIVGPETVVPSEYLPEVLGEMSDMGIKAAHEPNDANYYTLIDLQEIGGKLYGPEFEAWFVKSDLGIGFLFRLAKETGVVLLPGNGFEVVDTSARVSLANLTDSEYAAIGRFTRQVLDEYYQDFKKTRVDKK